MSQSTTPQGPPYASRAALIGGLPSVLPDIPVCAILLAMYLSFAALNQTIFRRNNQRRHKFLPTLFIFGFCMARVGTLVLRIAWSTRQQNIRLGIAANIFVNAGILIVYVLNLIFAQRILRAEQPSLGWNPVLRTTFKILYTLIGGALVMVITAVVLSVYTLNVSTLQACRKVQLAAVTYLLIFTTLPLLLLILAQVLPQSGNHEIFGQGNMIRKKLVVSTSTILAIIIAGFKAGAAWMPARTIANPAWYHSKAAFYIFGFALEILILCILTFSRIDKLLHVPNGSKAPGDYTRLSTEAEKSPIIESKQEEKA